MAAEKLDVVEALLRFALTAICVLTVARMALDSVSGDASFSLAAGGALIVIAVLLLNKEQGLAKLIAAWKGTADPDSDSGSDLDADDASSGGGDDIE